jgi:hypothetical protein
MISFVRLLELDFSDIRLISFRPLRTGLSSPLCRSAYSALNLFFRVFCISFRGQGQQYGAGLVGHTGLFISHRHRHLSSSSSSRSQRTLTYLISTTHISLAGPLVLLLPCPFIYATHFYPYLILFFLALSYLYSDTLFDIQTPAASTLPARPVSHGRAVSCVSLPWSAHLALLCIVPPFAARVSASSTFSLLCCLV